MALPLLGFAVGRLATSLSGGGTNIGVKVNSNISEVEMGKAVEQMVDAVAQEAFSRIVGRTAVDTGTLQSGWTLEFSGSGWERDFLISNGVEYVVFLENGTYKMAPQPMIRPTVEELPDIVQAEISKLRNP